MQPPLLQPDDALLVVDVQRDFCADGALPVPDGEAVVPVLNAWIEAAAAGGALVVYSRDWHPPDHASFREQGGPWPRHCVQHSAGAEFHPQLKVSDAAQVVSKAAAREPDCYSAFDRTDLDARLRQHHVRRLWIGGLALDYCVRATVLDARRLGWEAHVVVAATRAVDDQDGRQALADMRAAGAIIESQESS